MRGTPAGRQEATGGGGKSVTRGPVFTPTKKTAGGKKGSEGKSKRRKQKKKGPA